MTLAGSLLPPTAAEPKKEFLWVPRDITLQNGTTRIVTDNELATLKDSFVALKRSLVIDYEHQTLGTLPGFENFRSPDGTAPAAGWVGGAEIREDGLWATNVEWTPKAASALKAKEYKFTSPTIWWDGKPWKGQAKTVGPIGLTNDPDINGLTAVAARCSHAQLLDLGKESMMDPLKKLLAEHLGLAADAPDDQFVSAYKALKNDKATLTVSASKATELQTQVSTLTTELTTAKAAAGDVTALKATHTSELSALKTTHATEVTALKGQLAAAQTDVSASKAKLGEVVADMLEQTGRIAPADKKKVLDAASANPDVVLTAHKNVKLGAVVPVNKFEWGKATGGAAKSKNDHVSASKSYHDSPTERQALHEAAVKYADENKVTYTDAVIAIGQQAIQ